MSEDEQDQPTDRIGGLNGGAFEVDLESTPLSSWVTVGVMLVGAICVGVGLLLFIVSVVAAWALLAIGLGIGAVGVAMSRGFHLMRNTS